MNNLTQRNSNFINSFRSQVPIIVSYRNQSTDLQCKFSIWFSYDRDIRHESYMIRIMLGLIQQSTILEYPRFVIRSEVYILYILLKIPYMPSYIQVILSTLFLTKTWRKLCCYCFFYHPSKAAFQRQQLRWSPFEWIYSM